MRTAVFCTAAFLLLFSGEFTPCGVAQEQIGVDTERGDRMLADYFRQQTRQLAKNDLADIETLQQWESRREVLHGQLMEMLGLSPLPEKTDLKATVTGMTEGDGFVVENVHFQSSPGLYVTGNLYRPKEVTGPLPAVLYVCGHGAVKIDDVSYGNKVHYHHHGSWFARNGYICLIIDSLQLGEIESIHHGTHRYNMWWWLNRGYTPAGVEAWNCIRALDYLETREEVDADRLGVTGRSGGGAYSWWIAAIDERIKCAVPVAGITDLENHVVDGCVEGHCDCMFFLNTYRWDYATVAALVAPRPLLISNTDRDRIFPLDGVYRIHRKVKPIYDLYGAEENLALHITAGPHKDTQELRVHAFRWLNRFLRNDDELITDAAVKYFEPQQLQVFGDLPDDQINTEIHESFVAAAPSPAPPATAGEWEQMKSSWRSELESKTFRGWPDESTASRLRLAFDVTRSGLRLRAFDFLSQPKVTLRIYVLQDAAVDKPDLINVRISGADGWNQMLSGWGAAFRDAILGQNEQPEENTDLETVVGSLGNSAHLLIFPRGMGTSAWSSDERKQVQNRRRFYLLGQTLDGMRVWDIRESLQRLDQIDAWKGIPIEIRAAGQQAVSTLYAVHFAQGVDIDHIRLAALPSTHRDGPFLLNVSRILGVPQIVALVNEETNVAITTDDPDAFDFVAKTRKQLGWDQTTFSIRVP